MARTTFKNPSAKHRCGSAPKPDETKPNISGAVPTNRPKPIPIDFGPISGYFDHDPKLFNCEIAQPRSKGEGGGESSHGLTWPADFEVATGDDQGVTLRCSIAPPLLLCMP